LHETNGSRWIGLPSQKYTKEDGNLGYSPQIEFASKDAKYRFQSAAIEALNRFFEAQS
jgi:hypothetical protein